MGLVETVRSTIDAYDLLMPGDTVVVGVSGGADSLCLLHVLRLLAPEYGAALHVGHLDHGIRGAAGAADARYVESLCQQWDIPCTLQYVDVPALAAKASVPLEEGARRARYGFLAYVMHAAGGHSVAVGHHADDQVETVLMHFIRGAGLSGLRGMAPLAWMDGLLLNHESQPQIYSGAPERVRLLRPLLEVTRNEILAYCESEGLEPRTDETNADTAYYRNRIRHQFLPLLETYNRNVREVVRRTARLTAGDHDLLRSLVETAWPDVIREQSEDGLVLDLANFMRQPLSLRRRLVRKAIRQLRHTLRNIGWVHVDEALTLIEEGQVGASLDLPDGLRLTVDYREFVIARPGYVRVPEPWPHIDRRIPLRVPGSVYIASSRWTVSTRLLKAEELPPDWRRNADRYLAFFDASHMQGALALRTRQDGDWLRPLGLGHRQKLHDLYINNKIPRRERDLAPLLVCDDQICWVVGWRLDERFAVRDDTRQVLEVEFSRR